ncbi:recombinase [Rhodococcus sp. H29-C3]|uniref:recombinase n=1 Tax=Rhodococcus sp. H29-C3 TaxID=3046307 RepID=UPI0024BB1424|nr:recombinase [Rhodococcus sp. H29-C3]MDJ0361028.1 recombinase [Rhodococcus sp. H29-C3]
MTATSMLPQRDRHTWTLFEDWCTAHDLSALPATPQTLALFLGAHPAANTTHRRRVAVVGAAHDRYGLTSPARSEAVRAALDIARTERVHELASKLGNIVAQLPTSGWPAALFGRRDALILVLASTGLPYTHITDLRVGDVSYDLTGDVLYVDTATGICARTPRAVAAAGVSPVLVLRRWCEVLGFLNRYPSTTMLAERLRAGSETALSGYDQGILPHGDRPLLTSIDRWGHTPLIAPTISAHAVADIVTAHLRDAAPDHLLPARATGSSIESGIALDASGSYSPAVRLDTQYYKRGIAARAAAHTHLGSITSVLDDVEDRATSLLAALSELLDDLADADEC